MLKARAPPIQHLQYLMSLMVQTTDAVFSLLKKITSTMLSCHQIAQTDFSLWILCSVNKPAKLISCACFQLAPQVGGDPNHYQPMELKLSVMKPLGAR